MHPLSWLVRYLRLLCPMSQRAERIKGVATPSGVESIIRGCSYHTWYLLDLLSLLGFKFELPATTGISLVEGSRKASLVFIIVVWLCSFSLRLAITPACRSLSLCSSIFWSLRYWDISVSCGPYMAC